jgi:hypothetical protein
MSTLLWLPCFCTAVGAMRICVRALMQIINPNPKAGGCPGNGLHLYYLVGVHATNRVITCSLIYIKNIPCDECIRLDYYDVISTADELGMTIITLGRLYFLLSCWLTPTDATSMPQ